RLGAEMGLEGKAWQIENAAVKFEIASKADGPALLHADAAISPGSRSGLHLAPAGAAIRVLPPGQYVLRTKLRSGKDDIGEITRPFAVVGAPRITADTTHPSNPTTAAPL